MHGFAIEIILLIYFFKNRLAFAHIRNSFVFQKTNQENGLSNSWQCVFERKNNPYGINSINNYFGLNPFDPFLGKFSFELVLTLKTTNF